MPQINIQHSDGSTESISQTAGWKYRREIGEMWRLEIVVDRGDAQSVSLEKRSDEVELVGVATGRLVDVRTGGAVWTLIVRSFEWDAKQVEPLSGGTLKTGDDQSLFTDLVNDVPSWSVGSIANLTGPMEYVFNHAFRHEAARRVERNVPGELRFNSDKSVDCVESRGSTPTSSNDTISTGQLSFSDTGESGSEVGVRGAHTVEVELWGAGGADGGGSGTPGDGGYINVEIDTEDIDSLILYAGESGSQPAGGLGLYDGGDGGSSGSDAAGGGGAATSITTGSGTELVHADGGGGTTDTEGSFNANDGGGGGSRGGQGAENGEGSGFGGDGGDTGGSDGGDGGQEAVDSRVTVLDSTTGGGNTGGGEISYTATGTILSPSAGNLVGGIKIKDKGLDLDATHLRVIGAHEGEAQKYATLVPAADSSSYDNRVDYTNPDWSDGDDKTWARWENKDVTSQDTIEEEAAALAPELNREYVEAKATAEGEDLSLGDWVRVRKPKAGLDRDMRIVRVTTKTLDDTPAATVDEVLLSTRSTLRESPASQRMDVQRFNVGFQGSAVWGTPSGGYQAVTSSDNYRLTFYYPDVEYEHLAELYVESRPYRTFHSGAAAGGDHSHSVEVTHPQHSHLVEVTHPEHEHDVTISTTSGSRNYTGFFENTSTDISGENPSVTFNNIPTDRDVAITATGTLGNGTDPIAVFLNIHDGSSTSASRVVQESTTKASNESFSLSGEMGANDRSSTSVTVQVTTTDGGGSSVFTDATISMSERPDHNHSIGTTESSTAELGSTISETSDAALGATAAETSDASGDHTHPVDPGVSEFPATTATGCDVFVNGSETDTDIGSGSFEEIVDITDHLTKGAFNTVEVSSDSTGWLYATIGLEAYRQIGKG